MRIARLGSQADLTVLEMAERDGHEGVVVVDVVVVFVGGVGRKSAEDCVASSRSGVG